MELILATNNKHKVKEISEILKGLDIKILSLENFKGAPVVAEDKPTLKGNAAKKARIIAEHFKKWALADDTGLEVDYLGGEPGVYSARWAGPGCTYADNNRKLLLKLKGVPGKKRTARFKCVIAVSSPKGEIKTVSGEINGIIAFKVKGDRGFGYDPLFYVPEYKKTFAELDMATKNRISHRGRAIAKAKKLIGKLFV